MKLINRLPNQKIYTMQELETLTEADFENIRQIDSYAERKMRNNPGPKTAANVARIYMQYTPCNETLVFDIVMGYSGNEADETAIRQGIRKAKQYLDLEFEL